MVSQQLGEAWVALTAKDQGLSSGINSAVGGAIGSLGRLGMASMGIEAVIKALGGMVGAANPALMEQISFAFKDVFAALGHGVMPIFQALLPAIRSMGDLLFQLSPAIALVADAIAQTIRIITEAVNSLREVLAKFGLAKVSAAGLSGTSQAKMGDIAGAGREAMVKALQASAGNMDIPSQQLQEQKTTNELLKKFLSPAPGLEAVLKFATGS